TEEGEYQQAWIGDLPAGQSVKLSFSNNSKEKPSFPKWSFSLGGGDDEGKTKLTMDRMADLVRSPKTLVAGEVRLVGLIEQPLVGIRVDPAASQSGRGGTLVVAHLQEAPRAKPQPDSNCRRDFVVNRSERDLKEPEMDNDLGPET